MISVEIKILSALTKCFSHQQPFPLHRDIQMDSLRLERKEETQMQDNLYAWEL